MLNSSALLEALVRTRGWSLGQPEQPRATRDGAVLFLRAGPQDPDCSLYELDLASGVTRRLLSPEALAGGTRDSVSREEAARRERMRIAGGGFTAFELTADEQHVLVALNGRIALLSRLACRRGAADAVRLLAEPRKHEPILDPKLAPDARHVSFVRGSELHVLELGSGREWAVTSGGEASCRTAWRSSSRRRRWRDSAASGGPRTVGVCWSRRRICGMSSACTSPIPQTRRRSRRSVATQGRDGRTPSSGSASCRSTEARGPRSCGTPSVILYLAHVQWAAGAPPTIQVQTRDQRVLKLLEVDPDSGKTTELLEVADEAWVNLHSESRHPGYLWLPSGSGFLWTRELDEGWVLELHARDGTRLRRLCGPQLGLLKLWGLDEAGGWAVVEAGVPPERRLYRVSLSSEGASELLPEAPAGIHSAAFFGAQRLLVHVQASVGSMPRTFVWSLAADGAARHKLGELPATAEPLPDDMLADVEYVTLGPRGASAALVRPAGFDPDQRYPVLLSVYGGPHVNKVLHSRGSLLQESWLATQGFAVACVDGRGSWGRGRVWERPLAGRLGSVPLEEQVEGLAELGRRFPFLDLDRVGIFGWSFGGYLAALAVLKRPDLFCAAVAGAPVSDWAEYDTHYTERYLGLPQECPEAYGEEGLLAHAAALRRPLLLVHGTADDNVYFSHSLRLADALVRAGRSFELAPLAGQTHRVHDVELFRRQWERIAEFFTRHLARAARAADSR